MKPRALPFALSILRRVDEMLLSYIRLRKSIYSEEIRHWLKQIQHLFVVTVIILGTALPALFFFTLLAYGVILDNQSTSYQLLILTWSLLLSQSILLMLCKQAILGARYHYFLRSLEPSLAARRLSDILLALLSSPFLLLLLFVIINIDVANWPQLAHGFLLLALLVNGMMCSVYRQNKMHWALAGMLIAIPFLSAYSFISALFFQVGFLIFVQLAPSTLFAHFSIRGFRLPIYCSIWLQACLGNKVTEGSEIQSRTNGLTLVSASVLLVIVLTEYCAINLPTYNNVVYFIGTSLIILLCTSLQLSVTKSIETHSLFFQQFLWSRTFALMQYWVTFSVLATAIGMASIVFEHWQVLILFLSGLICLYFAKRLPTFFIAGWLLSVICGGGIFFTI